MRRRSQIWRDRIWRAFNHRIDKIRKWEQICVYIYIYICIVTYEITKYIDDIVIFHRFMYSNVKKHVGNDQKETERESDAET